MYLSSFADDLSLETIWRGLFKVMLFASTYVQFVLKVFGIISLFNPFVPTERWRRISSMCGTVQSFIFINIEELCV